MEGPVDDFAGPSVPRQSCQAFPEMPCSPGCVVLRGEKVTSMGEMMKKVLFASFLAACLLSACTAPPRAQAEAPLDVKIGQMLMVGFRGLEVDEHHPVVRDIRRHGLGGVVLFDYDVALKSTRRNIASPEQVEKLVRDLQGAAEIPLLVAVDEEGGQVSRLKERFGFAPTVSARTLGAGTPEQTRAAARKMAVTLASLGININLAPVVDLDLFPANPIIGRVHRSFGADPQNVARHAGAFIDAHREAGVLCTLKHFPGHGSSRADSHLGLTDITRTWSAIELEPFARLIREGRADAVMTAHVFHAGFDPQRPATLSPQVVTGLLRERLGFDGVVLSDDMQMKAVTDHFGLRTAIGDALRAGVDILVFGNNLEFDPDIVSKAAGMIREMVEAEEIAPERIDQSYRRIMRLKDKQHRLSADARHPPAGRDPVPPARE